MDLFDLSGRRALITGSSQGIGLALAKGLAAAATTLLSTPPDNATMTRRYCEIAVINCFAFLSDSLSAVEFIWCQWVSAAELNRPGFGIQRRGHKIPHPIDVPQDPLILTSLSRFAIGLNDRVPAFA